MMMLSGTSAGSGSGADRRNFKQPGTVIESDDSGNFKAVLQTGSTALAEDVFRVQLGRYEQQIHKTSVQHKPTTVYFRKLLPHAS